MNHEARMELAETMLSKHVSTERSCFCGVCTAQTRNATTGCLDELMTCRCAHTRETIKWTNRKKDRGEGELDIMVYESTE